MSIYERNIAHAKIIMEKLKSRGVQLYLDADGNLRAKGNVKRYVETIKLHKSSILDIMRPHCGICDLMLENYNGDWYCRMGCKQEET